MRIGIIGGLFPKEIRKEIEQNSTGPIQYAADALQWSLVNGLDDHTPNLSLINLLFIGSYPQRYKEIRMKEFAISNGNKEIGYNIDFINLPLYKLYSRFLRTKKYLLNNWISKDREVLMIYSIHTPFILAAIEAKNRNPNLRICLVVPDLPEFMGGAQNFVIQSLKRLEKKILEKALLKIDAFVILSEYMKEPLNINNRPWVCVEGIYSGELMENKSIEASPIKSIFYSGTLAKRYGIGNLLDAFRDIEDPNCELWICGDGDMKDEIVNRSNQDRRIKFYGQLPREEVLALQRKATVLVNPRTSEGEFTKYSFPSKTMEYLASGTPCILHELAGIPKEYFEYCFIAKEESPKGLRHAIVETLNKPNTELVMFGRAAQEFIIKHKTAYHQCGKIFEMLESL